MDMHEDLRWLAENVSEWNPHRSRCDENGVCFLRKDSSYEAGYAFFGPRSASAARMRSGELEGFTFDQWQAARQQLEDERINNIARNGNDGDHYATPEEDEEWQAMEERQKQARYQDAKGEDWIDEFARTATAEEFRGAMRFTIGKYNRRMGKKDDLVSEIAKMRDYCDRWLAYEMEANK